MNFLVGSQYIERDVDTITVKKVKEVSTSNNNLYAKCDISILPGSKSLSDVIKYSSTNPLIIVAPCTINIDSMEHETRLMISDDGGMRWSYTQIHFNSIEILNEGEMLVGVEQNTYLHVSVDTGLTWQKLNLANPDDKILDIIADTGFKYKIVIIGKNGTSHEPQKFESIDDKCYAKDNTVWGYYENICNQTNELVKSAFPAKKFYENKCVNDYTEDEELEICQYQFNYNTISLLAKNKLYFYTIYSQIEKIQEFPKELQFKERIYDVKVDKYQKCISLHVKKGIMKKCYYSNKELEMQYELVLVHSNIHGMGIDPRNGHLYFHDKNSISVFHAILFIRMTIYTTNNLIYYLKLNVDTDHLYVSYIEMETGKFVVVILTTSGDLR
ncbi:hypothetical protein RF11_02406 [Thelohanellus kitauei]|uniref:Uncharacterized protein n=1 Tax=Thelohanellus kitauei TaxID=669202 RepID=A0A0C2J1G5_THEKT|nr:hypothetical protein RF11_02406 [Thelohanellus kitauei]